MVSVKYPGIKYNNILGIESINVVISDMLYHLFEF